MIFGLAPFLLWSQRGLYALVLAAVLACAGPTRVSLAAQPAVIDGIIDLRDWAPAAGKPVDLGGTWEFVPNALTSSPLGTADANAKTQPMRVTIPSRWNTLVVDGRPFGSFGAATYRLRVLLPKRSADAPPLAIDVREPYTSGSILINGRAVVQSGNPGTDAATTLPMAVRMIAVIPAGAGDTIDINVQIANFLHHEGGLSYMPRIGLAADFLGEERGEQWTYLLVIGALSSLTMFFFAAYAAGRRDIGSLLFGTVNLFAIIRIATASRLDYVPFPSIAHEDLVLAEYLDLYFLIATNLALWRWLFPQETLKWLTQATFVVAGLALIAGLTLPVYWLTWARDPVSIYAACATIYGFFVPAVAWWRKRLGATPMLLMSMVAGTLFLHDIMANLKLIQGTDVGAFAFVAFALGNAIVLGQKAEHALAREEGLARALSGLNQSLEAQVRERTKHLEHEIERRTEAERISVSASAAKSDFLATMSHEIRTPLNGVIGLAQLLEEEIKDPDLGNHVRALVHAGELLQSIVSDILDFSKIEAGRFDINPAPTPIAAAIEDIAVLFRPQAEQKGVAFNLIQDPSLPDYISLDGNRLRQIVANLVGNAVKFTHEGFVEIKTMNAPATLGESGRRLVISVRDTGVGISMEAQPDLFKPFTQIRPSLADGQRGTGLGLSIAARLAELMDGRISVTSKPGAGSTFTVDLPLIEAVAPTPIAGNSSDKTPSRRLRVLVADDGEINRLILGEFIRREGHDVIFADDGAATVEIAKRELIDLIFMDIAMPRLDGFEATIAIRALPAPYGNVQIIAASATTQDAVQERCLAVGMNGFMPKPIRRPELVAFLQKASRTAKADGPSADAVGLSVPGV